MKTRMKDRRQQRIVIEISREARARQLMGLCLDFPTFGLPFLSFCGLQRFHGLQRFQASRELTVYSKVVWRDVRAQALDLYQYL